MAKHWHCFYPIAILLWAIMGFHGLAITVESDVQALQDLYRSLKSPRQLEFWKAEGGDPCAEAWIGVQCSGSSVVHIKLHRLRLMGNLGFKLSNLRSLKHLDVSSNYIEGTIPYILPPNVTYLNLSANKFSGSVPYVIENMKHLRHLNLSHNSLSGPLGDVFDGLLDLREMDLSFNNFTGDLPPSFRNLTSLKGLFLQNNQFTGSVIFLANLTLSDLNIEDNHFSGVLPEKFQNIPNLRIWGNHFDRATNSRPWRFPAGTPPRVQSTRSPPAANLSAFESHPAQIILHKDKKKSHATGIFLMVGGLAVLAACAALFIVIHRSRSQGVTLGNLGNSGDSMPSLHMSTAQDYTSMPAMHSAQSSPYSSSPMITPSRLPPIQTKTIRMSQKKSFTKNRMPIDAKIYTVAELQIATNSFSEEHLIGEGSLGSVYRAEFPDGTVLAVKNIRTVPLSIIEEQQFLDVIRNASRLRHPNIVTLLGYCTEYGQHLIVYEFIRKLSLHEALHCVTYKPLSWGLRLRIALGVARALNYTHSSVPPIAHSNLKASNVLLDEELMPRLSDCGLAVLRPLTSNKIKLKASEMAIADSGYIAPEHVQPGTESTKADIYAFGVLLLELLTGRMPFDNSRPKQEQSLASWASSRLHDTTSLRQMVDPSLSKAISSKSLSRYADIVSLCIQSEQEFRPPMSSIVESLMSLLQKPNAPTGGKEAEPFDKSNQSTSSRLFGSPTLSYYSV
ncbi:protein STRUBBELIG-RECEPTOR FAMILY 2 [Andrographis paniculata]|uniref:protein STRUBBELIG-RECEPTOR FAMILY 2 n=1 Tax=Andrographis paniculata TaxID=175694 RepID=UPI0021E85BA9|nr:protein STRUBBELIG-RECEPTOR FAMILY 2 [Andrographis paniculata]